MVKTAIQNGIMKIALQGELDDNNAALIRKKLDEVLNDEQIKKVIIDMSNLDFMDSTGIGVLLGRYKKMIERKIPAFIYAPKKNVDKVLNLSGIYKLMPKI